MSKPVAGTIAPAGTLARVMQAARTLTGAVTPAGTLARSTAKRFTGSVSPAGSLARSVAQRLAGVVAPIGALGRSIARFFGGLIGLSGELDTIIPGAAQPKIFELTGSYVTTMQLTVTIPTAISIVGSHRSTIALTGSYE